MNYLEFTAANKEYRLKLTTRATIALEKRIGVNPLAIFGEGDKIPTVTEMVAILHAALQQYEHGITLEDAYTIFDSWLDEGHVVTDFLTVIVDIYKVSGLIKGGNSEKN